MDERLKFHFRNPRLDLPGKPDLRQDLPLKPDLRAELPFDTSLTYQEGKNLQLILKTAYEKKNRPTGKVDIPSLNLPVSQVGNAVVIPPSAATSSASAPKGLGTTWWMDRKALWVDKFPYYIAEYVIEHIKDIYTNNSTPQWLRNIPNGYGLPNVLEVIYYSVIGGSKFTPMQYSQALATLRQFLKDEQTRLHKWASKNLFNQYILQGSDVINNGSTARLNEIGNFLSIAKSYGIIYSTIVGTNEAFFVPYPSTGNFKSYGENATPSYYNAYRTNNAEKFDSVLLEKEFWRFDTAKSPPVVDVGFGNIYSSAKIPENSYKQQMEEMNAFILRNIGDFKTPNYTPWIFNIGKANAKVKIAVDLEIEAYVAKPNYMEDSTLYSIGSYKSYLLQDQVNFIVKNSDRIIQLNQQCTTSFQGAPGQYLLDPPKKGGKASKLDLIDKASSSKQHAKIMVLFSCRPDNCAVSSNSGMFNYFSIHHFNNPFYMAYYDLIRNLTLSNYPNIDFIGYAVLYYTDAKTARP